MIESPEAASGYLYRPLSADEQTRTANLLPVISDALRVEAQKVGVVAVEHEKAVEEEFIVLGGGGLRAVAPPLAVLRHEALKRPRRKSDPAVGLRPL